MQNLPVHWREGMFLRPHQFQAAERYWSEVVSKSEQFDHAYNYGLRHVQLSTEAIENYQFEVSSVHLRMRDGTMVCLETGQQPDRIDLKVAFERETKVSVYLAIPKLRLGQANVAVDKASSTERFLETTLTLQDESFGGGDQEVQLRDLNICLLLSTDDVSGYEVLPIARVHRAGQDGAAPKLDEEYIPPVLAIDAWPGLGLGMVREIHDIIGARIRTLNEQIKNRQITLSSQVPGDFAKIFMLHVYNEAYATLGVLAFAGGVHPLVAYTELCRIVGMLSVFGEDQRVPTDIPKYDHDDLGRIFGWVKLQIESFKVSELKYVERYFKGANAPGVMRLEVMLENAWLDSSWSWFIGVDPGDFSREECNQLLQRGNWKMGAAKEVEGFYALRKSGLGFRKLDQAPRALPVGGRWVYYEVTREGEAWRGVLESGALAIRFSRQLILDMDGLPNNKTVQVQYGQKHSPMQFCLFAVQGD